MDKDYLQQALQTFNGGNWYSWKKVDSDGNKIPNNQRMTYANIKVVKDGATIPSEAEVNAKIQELKDEEITRKNLKASAKAKLIAGEPLTEEEANTIVL